MGANVHEVHIAVKGACAQSDMEASFEDVHHVHMKASTRRTQKPKQAPYAPTFLRDWREDRDVTLEVLGEKMGITHGQLSKIERGLSPYSQSVLEIAARELRCTVQDLLTRRPGEAETLFSLWPKMDERERRRFARFVHDGGE